MTDARRRRLAVAGTWAIVSALMLWMQWPAILGHRFNDADDIMRLLEVRDWLNGQSWWDVSQHRIGPAGLPMHWSRLVDLPLGAVEAPLRPLVGRWNAETVAIALVPLLTLAAAAGVLALTTRRLLGENPVAAALALVFAAMAPAIYVQIHPVRIDHHGWQIVLNALAAAALLDPQARRGGALAGLAMAASVNISLEGLPLATGMAGVLALLWLAGREDARRLESFVLVLAGTSALLLAAVAPVGRWSMPWCDSVLPQHVLALGIAAIGVTGAARVPGGVPARMAVLALTAVAAAATLAGTAPRCLAGPFGAMGPLSRRFWLDNVNEGLAIWRQPALQAVAVMSFPLVGLAGALFAWRGVGADAEMRRRWATSTAVLLVATALGCLLERACGTANILAVPGALALLEPVRLRLARLSLMPVRVAGGAAALLGLSPLGPIYLGALVLPGAVDAAPPQSPERCDLACGLAALDRLPPSLFFTGIDLGPRLIVETRHRAWTGAYHRSGVPMEQTIRAFTSPPEAARPLVVASGARYLLIVPDSAEAKVYAAAAPGGLMARLVRGEVPPWLIPYRTSTHDLSLYRVAIPRRDDDTHL